MKNRNKEWSESDIKVHYRDRYRYDPVDQYRNGNRFEKLWFEQRIRAIGKIVQKTRFRSDNEAAEPGGYWFIDIGSGTSAIGGEISKRFVVTNTLAMDISRWCVDKACEYHKGQGRMHFAVGDAFHLPVRSESASVVLLTEVIEHVKDYSPILKECKRILEPNGTLIITAPNKYHPIWHLSFLRKMFSSGYQKGKGRFEPFHRSFTYKELSRAAEALGFQRGGHRFAGLGITLMAYYSSP